jgi:hypothetical protein
VDYIPFLRLAAEVLPERLDVSRHRAIRCRRRFHFDGDQFPLKSNIILIDQILFRDIREKISDGLYDDPHRILWFVHVWAEMASISRQKMRCLASLRRGENRSVFLRE